MILSYDQNESSYEMYIMQGFITDQETTMEDVYGNVEKTHRFSTTFNTMYILIATVFASLKVLLFSKTQY